jgi:hypothetical protein
MRGNNGITTLDAISGALPSSFVGARLIKIDTDGFDLREIQGARRLIQANGERSTA